MGIYIPGIDMPENCAALVNGRLHKCPMYDADGYCAIEGREALRSGNGIVHGRPDWCPLIELPPHGRLIDADALKIYQMEENVRADGDPNEYEYDAGLIDGLHMAAKDVSVALTVVPADPEGCDDR